MSGCCSSRDKNALPWIDTCFEQNMLFGAGLRSLGHCIISAAARTRLALDEVREFPAGNPQLWQFRRDRPIVVVLQTQSGRTLERHREMRSN